MLSLDKFSIKKVSDEKNHAKFEIGPLPTGYGYTLGNILRRILLSSIPGSSITAVKIDGTLHEYSTIAGVSDDVLQILLSLKNVILVSKSLEPVVLDINMKGKDGDIVEVTAGDFSKSPEVEIVNPKYVITKLTSSKAKFNAQITVERGIGYKRQNEELRKELSLLPVDADFSPVTLVNTDVVKTRVGQETELDQLNLDIMTNGAVTPVEALHIATDLFDQMASHFLSLSKNLLSGNEVTVALNEKQKAVQVINSVSSAKVPLKISELNLSTRLTNALVKSNYDDLNKLEGMTEEELANIRGMGSKSLTELINILKKHNIKVI